MKHVDDFQRKLQESDFSSCDHIFPLTKAILLEYNLYSG